MTDAQDRAENFDDYRLPDERPGTPADAGMDLVQPDEGMAPDEEPQEIALMVSGDDTGDTALDREGITPAELAAIHVIDEQ